LYCKKVYPDASVPASQARSVEIDAARNEFESFQLIITPKQDIENMQVTARDLKGKKGVIPAKYISFQTVQLVDVKEPSDLLSRLGLTPDPLIPGLPRNALKKSNHASILVTAKVPKKASAGIYEGTLEIRLDNERTQIPLKLRVRNFELPDISYLGTYFRYSKWDTTNYYSKIAKTAPLLNIHSKIKGNIITHKCDFANFNSIQHSLDSGGDLAINF